MKAMVYEKYGPPEVLQLQDLPRPVPKANEILVNVRATTVTAGDWRMRKPQPALAARLYNGILRPRKVNILGFELAGVVEEAGQEASRFKLGDAVFAYTGFRFGGYAEYICLPDDVASTGGNKPLVAAKPVAVPFEQAAALPVGGTAALSHLRQGQIAAGKKVLINGASGSVGTYAVQLAKHFGAHVTGVCSTRNLEMVEELGADSVIDYTRQDVSAIAERYDLIYDAVGKLPRSRCKHLLAPGGSYRNVGMSRKDRVEDLDLLARMVVVGELEVVIDRHYALEQVADAHRYVEQGHKRGNVVIRV